MSTFKLCTSDSDFDKRLNSVFGSLDSISNNLQSNSLLNPPSKRKQKDSDDFKVPLVPKKSRQPLPGYIANPDKWAKYSMKDVKCSNNAENAKIAYELMEKLKGSSDVEKEDNAVFDPNMSKVIFKKPTKLTDVSDEDTPAKSKASKSSAFLLPEYEVGKSRSKKTKTVTTHQADKAKRSSEVTLTHLQFEDDIEEENE